MNAPKVKAVQAIMKLLQNEDSIMKKISIKEDLNKERYLPLNKPSWLIRRRKKLKYQDYLKIIKRIGKPLLHAEFLVSKSHEE